MTSSYTLRRRYMALFLVALIPMFAAIGFNLFALLWISMPLWVLGMGLGAGAIAGLQKTIGKPNLDPNKADEYQTTHINAGRSAAMQTGIIALTVIMFALLCAPLLTHTSLSIEGWAELVRSVGMLAGVGMLAVSFALLSTIARRMNADEAAES